MHTVLDLFDADAVHVRFREARVFEAIARRGFTDPRIEISTAGQVLPQIRLTAVKDDRRHLLVEACLWSMSVPERFFAERGFAVDSAVDLAVVYWVREEDPTRAFRADRPPLPLQRHPGLGALRETFRVIAGMAADAGKDGVGCMPKFFHDAVIFYRSRLFLFLDAAEQGRFEALLRDLSVRPLREVSLALLEGTVLDAGGNKAGWQPGYQVFPLSARLAAYFNSPGYEAEVRRSAATHRFRCDECLRSPTRANIGTVDNAGGKDRRRLQ